MLHMTEEEYQDFLRRTKCHPKQMQKKAQNNPLPIANASKQAKYFNLRVYVYEDGFVGVEKTNSHGRLIEKFDSIKEYQRCKELRMLQHSGKITELKLQVPFEIQKAFRDRNGVIQRAIIYKADFTYRENGETIVEDVKGYDDKKGKFRTTEAFRLKWKLLQAKYPNNIFRIV